MAQKMIYEWKPRAEIPIDAQVAGEELEKIRGHNSGELSAEAVVQSAAKRNSPLHAAFEWNDGRAATAYRLHQADAMIKSLTVTVIDQGGKVIAEPMTVSVRRERAGKDQSAAARVLTADELHAHRVRRGWAELDGWVSAYGAMPEFATIAMVLQGFLASEGKKAAA